jgi:hypothetical protein
MAGFLGGFFSRIGMAFGVSMSFVAIGQSCNGSGVGAEDEVEYFANSVLVLVAKGAAVNGIVLARFGSALTLIKRQSCMPLTRRREVWEKFILFHSNPTTFLDGQ